MTLNRRFDLAAIAKAGTRRKQVEFRPISVRLSFEDKLYRIILPIIREFEAAKPEIISAATVTRATLTRDAYGLGDIVNALRSAFSQITSFSKRPLQSLFEGEARRHDETWIGQVNRVIGVDLKAVVQSSDLEPQINLAVQQNVALIKGISDEVAKRIEVEVINLVSRGASNKELAKSLADIGGFARNRAKLIAVDQAGSFNATLNEIRHKQAGITHYTWSTVRDKRVRPLHAAREGQTFSYDNPPSDGAPGQPYRCRCVARPVLDLDAKPDQASERRRARREGTSAVAAALGL